MKQKTLLAAAVVAMGSWTHGLAFAQERLPLEPFGRVETARIGRVGAVSMVALRAEEEQPAATRKPVRSLTAVADLTDGKGFFESAISLQYVDKSSTSHPWSATLGYAGSGTEGAAPTDVDRASASAKIKLLERHGWATAVSAAYGNTRGKAQGYTGKLAITRDLFQGWSLSGNVGWRRRVPKSGNPRSVVIGAAGIEYDPTPSTAIGADYTFKNDLDGEDDFSLTATKSISVGGDDMAASMSVGKHGTFVFEFAFKL
jgi:hypothetical protein